MSKFVSLGSQSPQSPRTPSSWAGEKDNEPGANVLIEHGRVTGRLIDGRTEEQVMNIVDLSNPSLKVGVCLW